MAWSSWLFTQGKRRNSFPASTMVASQGKKVQDPAFSNVPGSETMAFSIRMT